MITSLLLGGANLTAIGLCRRLADEYELHLVAGEEQGDEGSLLSVARDAAALHTLPSLRRELDPRSDALATRDLHRLLGRLAPAIVHTHSSKAGIVGRLAAAAGPPRVVHTVHGWGHTPLDRPLRRRMLVGVERAMAGCTDALVAVSEDVRTEGLRCRIGRPGLYHVIPEMVDLRPRDTDFHRQRARARAALGLADERRVIGWVGRFVAQKDPQLLVAALGDALERLPDVRAVLVGDGPLRGVVERGLGDSGLADRAIFTGVRHDVRDLYAAFDVVLHPSLWEGQPRVIQESLAERVPVVATRVAASDSLIQAGANGYVTEPGNAREMTERCLAVLADERLRAPLPVEAGRILEGVAGEDLALAGHRDLYATLLAQMPRSRGRS